MVKKIKKRELYYIDKDGKKHKGPNPQMRGVVSHELWGNCSDLKGYCIFLKGRCTGFKGDALCAYMNLDDISAAQRKSEPNIEFWIDKMDKDRKEKMEKTYGKKKSWD